MNNSSRNLVTDSRILLLTCYRNILKLAESDTTDYYITDEVRDFIVNLQLPEDLECEHCVFQVHTYMFLLEYEHMSLRDPDYFVPNNLRIVLFVGPVL